MSYLSKKALEKLVKDPGKYKMEDNSWLSAKLQVWWVFVASLMPNWISANLITVAAVWPLAAGYAIMAALYSESPVPLAVQFFCGFAVFFFQTFDAVDGKHARRLGTSSPLGDFLDHVIDSVCIMLSACSLAMACSMTPLAVEFLCIVVASADFLVVHWESAKLMVMTMDNGSSITEAQLAFVAAFLAEPIFGHGLWLSRPFGASGPSISQMFFGTLVVAIGGIQIFTKSLPRIVKKCGAGVLPELLVPVCLEVLLTAEWFLLMPQTAAARISVHLFLISATVLTASCVTLDRLTSEPMRTTTILPLVIPGLFIPFLAPSLCLLYAAYCLCYVLFASTFPLFPPAHSLTTPRSIPQTDIS